MPFVDKQNKDSGSPRPPARTQEMDEILRKITGEMKRPQPSPDEMAAALQAVQRLAAEADNQLTADDVAQEFANKLASGVCNICGYQNRENTKFCGMCGVALMLADNLEHSQPSSELPSSVRPDPSGGPGTHYYHHHYHHHYFQSGHEAGFSRAGTDPVREEKLRIPNPATRGDMTRAEAAVRRVTQEWVLACNTKHLDDVLELYAADAMVLRSNYPSLRGAAAIREFFFGALDTGLGEVEMEPLRVDIVGELAYEAGRFKALVPSAAGKRREERGKYLWVCQRQTGGEWKIVADCWASDLTLSNLESDIPFGIAVKTTQPKKNS